MRTSRILASALASVALVAVLAGCSADDGTASSDAASKPTASAPDQPKVLAESDVRVPEKKVDVTCNDGAAIVDQSGSEVTLTGACATVTVSGNDSIVHLGDVDELIVESAITRITVGTVDSMTISGNANDVLYSGDEPEKVDDKGADNTIRAQGK